MYLNAQAALPNLVVFEYFDDFNNNMKRYYITILFAVVAFTGTTQNLPVYSQYFANPFLYNVGFVGVNGFTELNLNYRQQWAGIEDAPVTSTFNLQIPTKGNISYAISAYSEKAVLLRNSVAFGTFGYRVPFSDEHFINFGLAAGVGMSSIDLDGLDTNDPAFINAFSTSYYLDGQFGAYYEFKELNIGISLPKLFATKSISTESFQEINLSVLENVVYTLSYKFDLPKSMLSFTPYLLYRTGGNTQNQIEGTGILSYREIVYVGASYRVDYGPSLFLGLGIKENFKFGYAYEMATEQVASIGNGTHEFQLQIRLSKNKRVANKNKKVQPVSEVEPEVVEEQIQPLAEEPEPTIIAAPILMKDSINKVVDKEIEAEEEKPPVVEELTIEEPVVEESIDSIKIQQKDIAPLKSGVYIVVGVFKSRENAINFSKNIMDNGFENKIGQHKNELYYVYVQSSSDVNKASVFRKEVIQHVRDNFKKAWIIEIE